MSLRSISRSIIRFCLGVSIGVATASAQTDPFGNQFTYMDVFSNNSGSAGDYITINNNFNYPANSLQVTGNSVVGTSMMFEPNHTLYTSQPSASRVLRYYKASTLKEYTLTPNKISAGMSVNVTSNSLTSDTKLYLVCKTLDPSNSFAETSSAKTEITATGTFSVTLTGLSDKAGLLQVGFVMEGVTKTTSSNKGRVILTILNRNVTGTDYIFPSTSVNQLLRNGTFDIGTDPNYANITVIDSYFWTPFEGAYVGLPEYVQADPPLTGSKILILTGKPYAGAWHEGVSGIDIFPSGGTAFTLSFDAYFPSDYSAKSTSISFWNYAAQQTSLRDVNLNSQLAAKRGAWNSYSVRFFPTPTQFEALKTGKLRLKIQADERSGIALFNNFVLRQQTASEVGPQISVKINEQSQDNSATRIVPLVSPIVGQTTSYSINLENQGAENLNISAVNLNGAGFSLIGNGTGSIASGASKTITLTTTPSGITPLSGTLTIASNDKDSGDQSYVIKFSANPVTLNDEFSSGTPDQLGWVTQSDNVDLTSATSIASNSLIMKVNATDFPWSYQVSKKFVSPGTISLESTSLLAELKASGIDPLFGSQNKAEVRLESLDFMENVTGSIQLGQAVDEIPDRVVVILPEGGAFTPVGGYLNSAGIPTTFKTDAPYFRLVVKMNQFSFGVGEGSDKKIELNYMKLNIQTKGFSLSNGSLESGTYTIPAEITSITDGASRGAAIDNWWSGQDIQDWTKLPIEGVKKAVVTNTDTVYNATTPDDISKIFAPYAGSRAIKVYAQNDYSGGPWTPGPQIGTLYQEISASSTAGLTPGTSIHARGMAEVFAIDPLTGGSTFNYGFVFVNSSGAEFSRTVTTLTSANFTPDKWVPLTVNATIPDGTAKVRIISEFVQNASTDKGAVYLDDLSIGFGAIDATTTVGGSTYPLVWSDEFDGSSLNSANWTPEILPAYSFNNEQQAYTSDLQNLRVDNGSLIIQAVKSASGWTSARIKSQDKRKFQYGKIEFRARLPTGVGPWPAAWLLGNNISSPSTPWPLCGEIDVMEWRGGFNGAATSDANTVSHALHSTTANGGSPTIPRPPDPSRSAVTNPSSAFHTYAVAWTANNLVFSVDGVDKATLTPPTPDAAAFQKEFFLILNLAMGGSYLGNSPEIDPISPSLTSATYEVDYVRVYQEASATVTAPVAPDAPTFSAINSTGFTVNWGAVSEASSYRLDVSTSSTFATFVTQDLTLSGTSEAISGLTPSTTYYARVRAVNSGGISASSSNGTQATTASAPSAPATPTFSSVSSTGFTVNWVAVSGATSYRLDVSTSPTFATFATQDLTVSGTSQAVTGLSPGIIYYARVRAVNEGGTSASSSNGTKATLTLYQQHLANLGYDITVAFNADANGDGVKEGIKYAFNAASPRLGTSPATITRSGNTLTYTFDIRNDSTLSIVAELSTNLTSWTPQASSVITNGTGAAAGYIRKIVTITTTEPKTFIRLQVTGN